MYNQSDVYPYRSEYKKKKIKRESKANNSTRNFKNYIGGKLGPILVKQCQSIVASFSWQGVLIAFTAFFLGRAVILKELMPFGPAFLIAIIAVQRKHLPLALTAIGAGVFTTLSGLAMWEHFFVLVLLATVGVLYPINYERRWLIISLVVFVTTILGKGVLAIFFQPTLYQWVAVFFEATFAAAMGVAFTLIINALSNKGLRALSPEETLCLVILFVGVLSGMEDITLGYFSLQRLAANWVTMLVALGGGPGAGAAAGTLMGVVPSITKIMAPSLVGAYALGGLLAGIFNDYGKVGTVGGYILGNMILSVYLLGQVDAVIRFAEILAASLLLLAVPGWHKHLRGLFKANDDMEIHTQLAGISGKKVKDLSRVFAELARSFNETASTTQEHSLDDDMANIMNLIAQKVCHQCPMTKKCWDNDVYRTYKNLIRLFTLAENSGRVTKKDISAHINGRCTRSGEIATAVNFMVETYQVDRFWRKRLEESKGVVALQLNGVAEVMQKLVDSLLLEVEKRGDLEAVLARELSTIGITPYELIVFRRGRKDLEVNLKHKPCGGIDTCYAKILPVVTRIVGRPYDVDKRVCPIHSGAVNCHLRLIPSWTYHLETGVAQTAKKGSAICGDKVATFNLPEGKAALLISDGMGVGPKAARESNVTVNLLHKLLETGFSTDVAVKTANSIMTMRSVDDSFTTLDLVMIDLYSGEAEFVKIGAAPSWIKRGHRVEAVSRGNLPMGIFQTIEVESLTMTLQLGDILVMASDGILDQQEGERGLLNVLNQIQSDDPQHIADQLLAFGLKHNQGQAADDMTILVARMDRNLPQM
ncbi:stage II sporulation protein E [Metallumcola ferriviriculae]|uniref:Stage II sporulation protein E n=1 Tax=Metallumcola ferriviriculae TaxID=3039180 RepID=A0AAU0UJL0_9FIRM|nr:stage II sporulation protein E [Desulfitibacteraceae bacterium MK1]